MANVNDRMGTETGTIRQKVEDYRRQFKIHQEHIMNDSDGEGLQTKAERIINDALSTTESQRSALEAAVKKIVSLQLATAEAAD